MTYSIERGEMRCMTCCDTGFVLRAIQCPACVAPVPSDGEGEAVRRMQSQFFKSRHSPGCECGDCAPPLDIDYERDVEHIVGGGVTKRDRPPFSLPDAGAEGEEKPLDLTEIEHLLHETMPEPEGLRWRYDTIVRLAARIRELEAKVEELTQVQEPSPLHEIIAVLNDIADNTPLESAREVATTMRRMEHIIRQDGVHIRWLKAELDSLRKERERLLEDIEELRETLGWYASSYPYETMMRDVDARNKTLDTVIEDDRGAIARAALDSARQATEGGTG